MHRWLIVTIQLVCLVSWCFSSPYSLTKCVVSDKSYLRSQGSELFFKTLAEAIKKCPCSPVAYSWTDEQTILGSTTTHYSEEMVRLQNSDQSRRTIPFTQTQYGCVINIDFKSVNASLSNFCEQIYFQPRDQNGTLLNIYSTLTKSSPRSLGLMVHNSYQFSLSREEVSGFNLGSFRNAISVSNLALDGSGCASDNPPDFSLFSEMVDIDLIINNCTVKSYPKMFERITAKVSLANLVHLVNSTISNTGSIFDCDGCSLIRFFDLNVSDVVNCSSKIVMNRFPQNIGAISIERISFPNETTWEVVVTDPPELLDLHYSGITKLSLIDGIIAPSLSYTRNNTDFVSPKLWLHSLYQRSKIPHLVHIDSATLSETDCLQGCAVELSNQGYFPENLDGDFCLITNKNDSRYTSKAVSLIWLGQMDDVYDIVESGINSCTAEILLIDITSLAWQYGSFEIRTIQIGIPCILLIDVSIDRFEFRTNFAVHSDHERVSISLVGLSLTGSGILFSSVGGGSFVEINLRNCDVSGYDTIIEHQSGNSVDVDFLIENSKLFDSTVFFNQNKNPLLYLNLTIDNSIWNLGYRSSPEKRRIGAITFLSGSRSLLKVSNTHFILGQCQYDIPNGLINLFADTGGVSILNGNKFSSVCVSGTIPVIISGIASNSIPVVNTQIQWKFSVPIRIEICDSDESTTQVINKFMRANPLSLSEQTLFESYPCGYPDRVSRHRADASILGNPLVFDKMSILEHDVSLFGRDLQPIVYYTLCSAISYNYANSTIILDSENVHSLVISDCLTPFTEKLEILQIPSGNASVVMIGTIDLTIFSGLVSVSLENLQLLVPRFEPFIQKKHSFVMAHNQQPLDGFFFGITNSTILVYEPMVQIDNEIAHSDLTGLINIKSDDREIAINITQCSIVIAFMPQSNILKTGTTSSGSDGVSGLLQLDQCYSPIRIYAQNTDSEVDISGSSWVISLANWLELYDQNVVSLKNNTILSLKSHCFVDSAIANIVHRDYSRESLLNVFDNRFDFQSDPLSFAVDEYRYYEDLVHQYKSTIWINGIKNMLVNISANVIPRNLSPIGMRFSNVQPLDPLVSESLCIPNTTSYSPPFLDPLDLFLERVSEANCQTHGYIQDLEVSKPLQSSSPVACCQLLRPTPGHGCPCNLLQPSYCYCFPPVDSGYAGDCNQLGNYIRENTLFGSYYFFSINEAITECQSPSRTVVLFPGATYSETLFVSNSIDMKVVCLSSSEPATIESCGHQLFAGSIQFSGIRFASSSGGCTQPFWVDNRNLPLSRRIAFDNCTFDGSGTYSQALSLKNMDSLEVDSCEFFNISGSDRYSPAISISNANMVQIIGSTFFGVTRQVLNAQSVQTLGFKRNQMYFSGSGAGGISSPVVYIAESPSSGNSSCSGVYVSGNLFQPTMGRLDYVGAELLNLNPDCLGGLAFWDVSGNEIVWPTVGIILAYWDPTNQTTPTQKFQLVSSVNGSNPLIESPSVASVQYLGLQDNQIADQYAFQVQNAGVLSFCVLDCTLSTYIIGSVGFGVLLFIACCVLCTICCCCNGSRNSEYLTVGYSTLLGEWIPVSGNRSDRSSRTHRDTTMSPDIAHLPVVNGKSD